MLHIKLNFTTCKISRLLVFNISYISIKKVNLSWNIVLYCEVNSRIKCVRSSNLCFVYWSIRKK